MNYKTEILQILDQQEENGGPFWSREDGDIYHPIGHSTIQTLGMLGVLGATPKEYPILREAIDFLFDYQTPEGHFKYSKTSAKLPCVTTHVLIAMGHLGVHTDKRVAKSYQLLLDTQRTDGGWRCNTVKLGKSPQTDASNPGTTLYILDAFRFRKNSQREKEQLNPGITFLLQHWDSRHPLGPCDFGIGSRFFQIEFPFLRYNLFYYTYVLSFYPQALSDKRYQAAYQMLLGKTEKGKIRLENPHRSWRKYNFAKKGKISELATRYWNEMVS